MSDKKQPNIVFVLTDDQGYPPMGCHGHPFVRTPELDKFHGESVRFEQFHSGTTCAPTRAGLFTGHYCNSTGVWHTVGGRSLLRKDEWTLAAALIDAGYKTGIFGKWHLGDEYPYRPQDRGFQRVIVHGGGGISQQPDHWGNDYFDDTYMVDGVPKPFKGYCTDVFFSEAMGFIEKNKDQPFFCYISTNAPHGPWNVEPVYRDLYTNYTESDKYARFLGMITNIDENFGRLRKKLQELNLEENTILVFMSDNGQTSLGDPAAEMYNSNMRGFKGSPYDGGHRIPFLMRWPGGGISTARSIEQLASYVDFMPTLLDLCGIEVPAGQRTFHGESLRPLLEGVIDSHWTDRVITTDTQRLPHPQKWRMSCVMKDSWRLVNRNELYNLATDFSQQNNIAGHHPEMVKKLQDAYEEWWKLCSEQMDDDIPISIGAEAQELAVLRAHDLRDDMEGSWLYTQEQVRQGTTCAGWWEVMVETEGEYEFELRRWPEEAGHRVRGNVEGKDVLYHQKGVQPGAEGNYSGGVAIDIDTAALTVSGFPTQWVSVKPEDRKVVIRMRLPVGPRHVRSHFSTANGRFFSSAYYVYVRLMK